MCSASRSTSRPRARKRRQLQGHHRQPVVEVGPEPPGLHRGRQVLARRRDHAHVQGLAARAAEAPHRPLLEDLQELRLERERQEADLVQEDGATVGDLEESGLGLARVGERAALEAEQLGLDQGLRDGGAVDVHERRAGAAARPVDGRGQQPLAGSGLAENQDRRQSAAGSRRRSEEPTDLLADRDDGWALAQELPQSGHEWPHRTHKHGAAGGEREGRREPMATGSRPGDAYSTTSWASIVIGREMLK